MKTKLILLFTLAFSWHVSAAVLPSDAIVAGKTQGEWSAEWWQWVFPISTNQNPLLDPTGQWAHVNQSGPVFFLVGTFAIDGPGAAHRTIAVSEAKHIFFPLNNYQNDNVNVPPPLPTIGELYEVLDWVVTNITELHASIDGVPVPNLREHRVISPVYSLEFTDPDNLYTYFIGQHVLGVIEPAVADGYYLMLEPLTVGVHVITFSSSTPPPIDSSFDITYTITVVEVPVTDWVEDMLAVVEQAPLGERDRLMQPLLRAHKAFAGGKTKPGMNHLRGFQRLVERRVAPDNPALATDYMISVDRIIERAMRDL